MEIPLDVARELASIDSVHGDRFLPDPELEAWAREHFVEGGEFHNEDHEHLQLASLGFVLTNVTNKERGRRIVGTCQLGDPGGKPWPRAQKEQQFKQWFGFLPDFVITLDACFLAASEALAVCAVIDHELYHAAQRKDEYGSPMYTRDAMPIWALRAHDIEEFTGVARRFGCWNEDLEEFSRALATPPIFGRVRVDGICGCGARVA